MNEERVFTATNGVVILRNEGGYLISDDFDYLTLAAQNALREYFDIFGD